MRGWDAKSDALFSYVSCEARVPKDHPLRPIRRIVDEALDALSPQLEQLDYNLLVRWFVGRERDPVIAGAVRHHRERGLTFGGPSGQG